MESLIAASVVIGDRTYRIRIKPDDEETVRKTVKLINEKIIEFKTQFAGKDMQDYIAMVLMWLASEKTQNGTNSGSENENLTDRLLAIEKLLDL